MSGMGRKREEVFVCTSYVHLFSVSLSKELDALFSILLAFAGSIVKAERRLSMSTMLFASQHLNGRTPSKGNRGGFKGSLRAYPRSSVIRLWHQNSSVCSPKRIQSFKMLSQSNAQLDALTFGPYCDASIQSRGINISTHHWYAGSRKHPQPEKYDDLVYLEADH
ncbi:hypothetical protein AMTR_s00196p00027890 [Amborella trichopoda]|uniref:Uncharacterized protein n=1 Tax=Amborella trichopoda TaxID=13333 RepID=U5D0X1_AMBTC|nr:hypothetical protein AMTR_s00196p00027890 [Amborella trichopoda]